MIRPKKDFKWKYCYLCGPMVICPTCGNNSCNSTYGPDPVNGDHSCIDCIQTTEVAKAGYKRYYFIHWKFFIAWLRILLRIDIHPMKRLLDKKEEQ